MNTQVGKYISEVTYDPSDYSYSSLSTYVIATDYDKGKPFGVAITIPEAGTLTLSDGSHSMSYSVSAGSHTIYNITPSVTGSLRMINASATYNIRDLGGWSCDGGTVITTNEEM